MVHPGLEEVTADEITRDLGGDVRKTAEGIVVFRLENIDRHILTLRTTEDVFLLAWGSDELSHRATDLDLIERWTARDVDWPQLLRIHHAIRPRPKGKPTYRLVVQMEGTHGYLRKHAREALARGLARHFPDSWREAEENAAVEVWLTIDGPRAICGLRLSDRTMRHRTWKMEHRAASLRPTLAAALVRVAAAKPGQLVLDPMCGAGTILAEQLAYADRFRGAGVRVLGGDVEYAAARAATLNLRRLGAPVICQWDARRLPLAGGEVDCVVCNPPFGKQLSSPAEVGPLYAASVREMDRVLKPGGQAVLLVSDAAALRQAAEAVGWRSTRRLRVRILGQPAQLGAWRKEAR
jgi:23S rRNA G2445 N2-methylase RlmL